MKKGVSIKLSEQARAQAIAALREYSADNFDEAFGDLKAALLLDFVLDELGPSIYNQGIVDARAFVEERAADLDAALHHAEFPRTGRRRSFS